MCERQEMADSRPSSANLWMAGAAMKTPAPPTALLVQELETPTQSWRNYGGRDQPKKKG
jgi:hypothetical protein